MAEERERYNKLKKEKEQLSKGDIETFKKNMDAFYERELEAISKLPDVPKFERPAIA